jgi:hypothetical protein
MVYSLATPSLQTMVYSLATPSLKAMVSLVWLQSDGVARLASKRWCRSSGFKAMVSLLVWPQSDDVTA